MKWVACFLLLLVVAAGCVLEDKPVDPGFDAGSDSGLCGGCGGEKPVCVEDQGCVQCTVSDDAYCDERSMVCDPDTSSCVDCLDDSQCTAVDAARCDAKACIPCNENAQCDDVDGLPGNNSACFEGDCVECTQETEEMTCPDGDSCNPRTKECTGTDLGSLEVCQACKSDSDCGDEGSPSAEFRCVAMEYDGERFPDGDTGFCLKVFSPGGCEQPYAIRITDRESLSGDPVQSYCGINELLATCPAVRALKENVECETGDDEECHVSGLCRDVGGLADRCTYRCSDVSECKSAPVPGSTCGSSGPGDDDYCGG